jgi:hypothetical protein
VPDVQARFLSKVSKLDSGCWHWLASYTWDGYGRFKLNRQMMCAHRVSYLIYRGEIAAGLVIDHLCKNRSCVNPAHLEAVTIGENNRRAARSNELYCANGHKWESKVIYKHEKTSQINCRACNLAAAKRYYRRKSYA